MTIQSFTGYSINTVLESGWYDTQIWGSLHKAWLGYVIAKNKGEYDKQMHYASVIKSYKENLIWKYHVLNA